MWSMCSWVMTMASRVSALRLPASMRRKQLAATEAAIDQDAGASAGDNGAVSFEPEASTVKRTIS